MFNAPKYARLLLCCSQSLPINNVSFPASNLLTWAYGVVALCGIRLIVTSACSFSLCLACTHQAIGEREIEYA